MRPSLKYCRGGGSTPSLSLRNARRVTWSAMEGNGDAAFAPPTSLAGRPHRQCTCIMQALVPSKVEPSSSSRVILPFERRGHGARSSVHHQPTAPRRRGTCENRRGRPLRASSRCVDVRELADDAN